MTSVAYARYLEDACAMDAVLPGIKPTGQWVELPHVVIVGLEDGKVAYGYI
jgi:hypothetical protein